MLLKSCVGVDEHNDSRDSRLHTNLGRDCSRFLNKLNTCRSALKFRILDMVNSCSLFNTGIHLFVRSKKTLKYY